MIPHEGGEIGLEGLGLREEEEKGSGGFRDESGVIHPGWVVARIMVLMFSYNRASGLEAYIPFSASLAFRSKQIPSSFSSLTQIRAHWDPSAEGKSAAPCTRTVYQLFVDQMRQKAHLHKRKMRLAVPR